MNKPLADRIRPKTIDDIVGQKHLIAPDRPLRKIIESGDIPNLIFYGPSGVGKTTLATYIAKKTNRTLKKLNGTTASTADIKEIVAQLNTFSGLNGILLYLDEIQYFNKKQQQTLLEYIENGSITLIAQRICLIRSLIFEPKVLLLDEVTSALDATNTSIVENVIDELHKKGITIISITHNEEQSLRTANRRITIVDGQLAKEEVLI